MDTVTVGSPAPQFTLQTGEGTTFSLSDCRGKKVVLFFYPKDNTTLCTREACAFNDNIASIAGLGAVILGVSPDSVASHKKFSIKYGLQYQLLSDEETSVHQKYGVWQKKIMFGRKYLGVIRSTFIINESGIITHIFRKVRVMGHMDAVLNALSES